MPFSLSLSLSINRRKYQEKKTNKKFPDFLFPRLSDANHAEQPDNLMDILSDEQRNFIAGACNVDQMIHESREFRRKFEFFVRLNNLFINLSNEVANEALDLGKEQAFRALIEDMQYGMTRFCPKISSTSI